VDGSRVSLSMHEEAILASKGACFGSLEARLHFPCLKAEILFWLRYDPDSPGGTPRGGSKHAPARGKSRDYNTRD